MIKVLHCADLHLDSPLTALDISRSETRRMELRAAFTSLTLSAKMNKADFLLISGDLFDGAYVSRETVALLCREFAAIPECYVIIAPGNHDPYTPTSYYNRAEFPENVYIFDSPELSCFDFPDKNTTVYGWAFTSSHMENCPLEGFTVEDPSKINLLVAHGDFDVNESQYCPIGRETLAGCGFDYAALGHIHTHNGVENIGNGYVAYSGCLEGRGFDECGIKGALLVLIEKETELSLAARFVRFCKRCYADETCDVSGAETNADLLDKLRALIAEKHYGDDTALRVRLVGNVSGELKPSPAFLAEQFGQMFILEIVDETLPLADGSKLADDPTLRGEYYRSLRAQLESDDADEREIAVMALRYGLAALSGGDITDC